MADDQVGRLRAQLSSLQSLLTLSTLMANSGDQDRIVDLAGTAVPSLSCCRLVGIYRTGLGWVLVGRAGSPPEAMAELADALGRAGSPGGAIVAPHAAWPWAWAYSMRSFAGHAGFLVVAAAGKPPAEEQFVLQALAQQTGVALVNATLQADERAAAMRMLQRHSAELERSNAELARSNAELEQLTAALQRQADLLDLTDDAIVVCDLDDRVVFWNRGAERLYGWGSDDAIGTISSDLLRTVSSESAAAVRQALELSGTWEGELTEVRRDGSPIVVWSRQALQRAREGIPIAVLASNRDITERVRAERRSAFLAEAGKLLSASLDVEATLATVVALPVPELAEVCLLDRVQEQEPTRLRQVAVATPDPALQALLEQIPQRFPLVLQNHVLASGRPLLLHDLPAAVESITTSPEHLAALHQAGFDTVLCVPLLARGRTLGTVTLARGRGAPPFTHADEVFAEELASQAALAIDNARLHQQLTHQAHHDVLTGLPNRMLFLDRLQVALNRTRRHPGSVAVLLLDLDRFKLVNDSLGHPAGDRLLKLVAERLTATLRPSDTVARFGGDEFALLCEDLDHTYDAGSVAQRVVDAMVRPWLLDGRELVVTPSIGVAVARDADADALLRDADAAMYRAKASGKARWELFDHAMRAEASARLELEGRLRHAIDRQQLTVHYQPLVDVHSGAIRGVEALLRWPQPDGSLLPPGQFIPLAEDTGLIVPIGAWVVREACRQAARWQPAPSTSRRFVAVNLSARQLAQPDLVDTIADTLSRYQPGRWLLCLEVTETALMSDIQAAAATLDALQAMGIEIAIDDFGTGYSSFEYLRRLPIDHLKIDQSFVRGLPDQPQDAAIVAAMVNVAHILHIPAIAEGVETARQLDELHRLGCDLAQGFLFAPAAPAEAIDRLLALPDPFPAAGRPHRPDAARIR